MNEGRGRPVDRAKQSLQKEKLLLAAREFLKEKSYKSVTVREVADRAGVNSAMVRYYFKNKEGLFVALFKEMSQLQFSQLQSLSGVDEPLKIFIQRMLMMACQNCGLVRFIHDEVLSGESTLKKAFINGLPKNIAHFLPRLIQQQMDQGKLRTDLDPKLAAFSLMSIIMMPVVIEPVREEVWNIPIETIASPEWAEHVYRLFIAGCQKEHSK